VLFANALETRTHLEGLDVAAPDLAAEFTRLREAVEAAEHGERSDRRAELDRAWQGLLGRIRALPGFADFLRPALDRLRRHASAGPVVHLVAHGAHGFALVVDAEHGVRQLVLDGFTEAFVAQETHLLLTALRDTASPARGEAARDAITGVLGRLWDVVTGPVLTALGHTGPPAEGAGWPRVWWCPVGPVASLPLHAAGHHTRPGESVVDRVVSSYTPTIRALGHAARPRGSTRPATLVVSVPDLPGGPPLPGAAREARTVRELVPGALVLVGADATADAVVPAMARHHVAHFACHGVADPGEPARSTLLLPDHADDPLTVARVASAHLESAELAFLSACATSGAPPRSLDEATHLTGAFQLAGYRSVIGTLWPVNDTTAHAIARDVYRHLTRGGTAPPATATAAHALHHAVHRARERHRGSPDQWAAHVHAGA
jgi:hypothetical protein